MEIRFKQERVCPRDERHDPHAASALFCWVCGKELVCEDCGLTLAEHDLFRDSRCPVVRVRVPPLSLTG
jgi:hypothetical protein